MAFGNNDKHYDDYETDSESYSLENSEKTEEEVNLATYL
jgi:hypothetical protein